jgi:cell division protein FtsL
MKTILFLVIALVLTKAATVYTIYKQRGPFDLLNSRFLGGKRRSNLSLIPPNPL